MNAFQKATFAVSALAITLIGGALATAPIAFARSMPVLSHGDCSAPSLQLTLSGQVDCQAASRDAGLIALNGR